MAGPHGCPSPPTPGAWRVRGFRVSKDYCVWSLILFEQIWSTYCMPNCDSGGGPKNELLLSLGDKSSTPHHCFTRGKARTPKVR